MTRRSGLPCPKCGANEWDKFDHCIPCSRKRRRQWDKNNPEKAKAHNKEKYSKNREKNRAKSREWRRNNREKHNAIHERWRKNNPDKWNAKQHRYRAKKKQNGGNYTAAEWKQLCEFYENKCLCCGRTDVSLTVDHVIPLFKGGSNSIDNIQPLCMPCNAKKHMSATDYRQHKFKRWIQLSLFE